MDHSRDDDQWVAKEAEWIKEVPFFSDLFFHYAVERGSISREAFIDYIPVVIPQWMIAKGEGSVTIVPPVNERWMIDVFLFSKECQQASTGCW